MHVVVSWLTPTTHPELHPPDQRGARAGAIPPGDRPVQGHGLQEEEGTVSGTAVVKFQASIPAQCLRAVRAKSETDLLSIKSEVVRAAAHALVKQWAA